MGESLPLTRAWCLWEVYCCNVVGAQFSVTLGREERGRFEEALCEDSDVLLDAFAGINVANAEAGKEEDRAMILAAVRATEGGASGVNALVLGLMRGVFVDVARGMAAEGEDLGMKRQVANLLENLGHRAEARTFMNKSSPGTPLSWVRTTRIHCVQK